MARVTLVNVSKIYQQGRGAAVQDVSLDIADGEFVVLVGPSGCGKSTTLRMIAGLETVSAGTISIGDREVTNVGPSERDIAMVFQSYALYPHMSVRENLGFALSLRKLARAEIDRRVQLAATSLGLEPLLDRKPRQLSGGQRQRVAVGRAIVREPQVFLFDEPLSNLDAALRAQTRRELAALHRTLRATMIYVTHDQVEAMTLGQRIVVMKDGQVQQVDTPLALYEHPTNRFVAGFIGSPSMNFLETVIDATAGRMIVTGTAASLPLPVGRASAGNEHHHGRRLTLGVRAEHLRLGPVHQEGAIPAVVELVELMGSETYVYARVERADGGAGALLVCRAPARTGVTTGSRVGMEPDLSSVHLFDEASGARVNR